MCSCLQLPQRGLPCRHYFAVLLNHPDILFGIDVVHPRWLTAEVKQRAPGTTPLAAAAAAAATLAPDVSVHPLFRLTVAALKAQLVEKGGEVRGLKHKTDFVHAILACKRAAAPQGDEGGSSTTAAPEPTISSEAIAASPPASSEAIAAAHPATTWSTTTG
jgi:hypothetical protein